MLIPFGITVGGNKSWLHFPFLPVNIQAAEVCKMTFILIMASVMGSHQNRPSAVTSVLHLGFHLILFIGPNLLISGDMGVSLIFVFIFIGMAFAGGVNILWFLGGIGAIAAGAPILWSRLGEYQQNRILILFDPTIDPTGIGPRYHTRLSLESLTGGGLLGQGLFNGTRTQTPEALPAQHTDFIFSAIGEELGYAGCALVLLMLFLIIARCFQVGMRSQDYMRRLVCFGAASALIFQVVINVGMCIGVMPVIGITLPFISYGGSSIVTLYAMLGLVSGVHERPAAASHERYIRAPYLR
jgi:rod shape determining protein RodA